jgi:hypothetical protein
MNAISWIFSLLTGLVLTVAALIHAFILMWGMENFKTSVKPYAYALFGALSLVIIVIATAVAGPISLWAAKKMFPNDSGAGFLICLLGGILAIVVGIGALFVSAPLVLAIFDDPLPQLGFMMRLKFPEKTKIVYNRDQNTQSYDTKLIVKLDEAGWEEFRRNSLFQTQELRIVSADNAQNPRSWRTFEIAESQAQSYRWVNHADQVLLKVLARRTEDGQIYVYLFLQRGVKF